MGRLIRCDTRPVQGRAMTLRPNVTKKMHAWGVVKRVHGALCLGKQFSLFKVLGDWGRTKIPCLSPPSFFLSLTLFSPQLTRAGNRLRTI